jgi:hypothetical protein
MAFFTSSVAKRGNKFIYFNYWKGVEALRTEINRARRFFCERDWPPSKTLETDAGPAVSELFCEPFILRSAQRLFIANDCRFRPSSVMPPSFFSGAGGC